MSAEMVGNAISGNQHRPGGAMATSSANRLVGTDSASRYWLQHMAGF